MTANWIFEIQPFLLPATLVKTPYIVTVRCKNRALKAMDSFLSTNYKNLIFLSKVRQKQSEGFSWSVAMSEVRIKRMIQKYKDNGELDSEDPALLMLKTWPASGKYKDNPDRLPGLEQLVCIF